MMTLNMKIEELEAKLTECKATVGKGVLGVTPSHNIDVPKSKKLRGQGL